MKISVRILLTLVCLTASARLFAQDSASAPAPQNARQALLDMFFGKPGSMERHLPEATRKALREATAGGPSLLQQFSLASTPLNSPDTHLQTFETGSTLLSVENTKMFSKFEAIVDKDDLSGDEDDIQLSFQMYKNGQPEKSPVLPSLTFVMKQEKNVWRLSEISVTVRVALADPQFLKTIVEGAKAHQLTSTLAAASSANSGGTASSPFPNPRSADEASAIGAMHSIAAAEKIYAATYRNVGFTCTLSDLDGFGQGTPNEHQAMLIESRLASGKKRGYMFTLSGCGTAPNAHFELAARPVDSAPGRAFCSDETAVLRTSEDGQPTSCFTKGTLLPVFSSSK